MADHEMDGSSLSILDGFKAIDLGNKAPGNAWTIFKDQANPQGVTRGQWLAKNKQRGPNDDQFSRNPYAIHTSFTGNEKLKVNGEYGKHDYMPPELLFRNIQLSHQEMKSLSSIKDGTERAKKEWSLKGSRFREIATEIGIPTAVPKFEKELHGQGQLVETIGGGMQRCKAEYKGSNAFGIPNIQIWKNEEILATAWHTSEGDRKYDKMSLKEAVADIKKEYGEDVDIALKSSTNRMMSVEQLAHFDPDAGERLWNMQAGRHNESFGRLTVAINDKKIDVETLMIHAPEHDLVKMFEQGEGDHYLRVLAIGEERTSVQLAMKRFPAETTALLAQAGIPEKIAINRPDTDAYVRAVAEKFPPVTRRDSEGMEEALDGKADLSKPGELMIADRDNKGRRTGVERTLLGYQEGQLRLPDDAAAILELEPDVYSKDREKSRYDERSRDGHDAGVSAW